MITVPVSTCLGAQKWSVFRIFPVSKCNDTDLFLSASSWCLQNDRLWYRPLGYIHTSGIYVAVKSIHALAIRVPGKTLVQDYEDR